GSSDVCRTRYVVNASTRSARSAIHQPVGLAPTRIAGECTKLPPRFGFEDAHKCQQDISANKRRQNPYSIIQQSCRFSCHTNRHFGKNPLPEEGGSHGHDPTWFLGFYGRCQWCRSDAESGTCGRRGHTRSSSAAIRPCFARQVAGVPTCRKGTRRPCRT